MLDEFLRTILAGGYVEEWYKYGGEPYSFKAYVWVDEGMEIPLGYGNEIKHRISIYKNARSWLERFSFVIRTKFHADIRANNRIKFQSSFFSRDNQPFSLLNGIWGLNAKRYLNGYECEKLVDFYPVKLQMQSRSRMKTLSRNALCIRAGGDRSNVDTGSVMRLRGSGYVLAGGGVASKVVAEVCCNGSTISYMTKRNRVDSTWELDGGRKLNGGRYIL